MIVDRWTWKVKFENREEFEELLKAERERAGIAARIYVTGTLSTFGPPATVMWEVEYESEEERTKALAEWWSQPEAQEWAWKLWALVEVDSSHELWLLI
jgi:hypothetical protein